MRLAHSMPSFGEGEQVPGRKLIQAANDDAYRPKNKARNRFRAIIRCVTQKRRRRNG